ncbi:hypothetical protein AFR_32215 [Actinoplanes friuliensis DSM 7358]|uniref:Uncharacterized protein n=1 Tax=Actinoplanes friuliensis DSM 7358 TaxID=1246995 RepID=U5W9V7_9ACTN|nr:hypothetical protein AFR_32215 [Actinoplanes friuliensis DSM 7358]
MLHRPFDRLPFRGEDREGPERRAARVVGGVAEEGDRGFEARVGGPADQGVGFRWAFDQDEVGALAIELLDHRTG